jgi:hypothetical protein
VAKTGPPCPLCGQTGIYAHRMYIPPANHRRRILRVALRHWAVPGVRPADVVFDECPLLDGEPVPE